MRTRPRAWQHRDPARYDRERQMLQADFPAFQWGERPTPGTRLTFPIARGYLQPLTYDSPVGVIAAHLKRALPLHVGPTGALAPTHPDLPPLDLSPQPELYRPYLVEVQLPEPPAVPTVLVVEPLINRLTFPEHPHLLQRPVWVHGDLWGTMNPVCVFAPHDGVWRWTHNTAADVVRWTAVWLANHVLWDQQGRVPGAWLGPESSHDPSDLLRTLQRDDPCHCGSGRAYSTCCRTGDLRRRSGSLSLVGA